MNINPDRPTAAQGAHRHGQKSDPLKEIKAKIKSRFAMVHKWRPVGIQMSLDYANEGDQLIEKMFECKRHDLLEETYKMVFHDGINHYLVFETLVEYLRENALDDNFPEVQRRDVGMLIACLEEHARSEDEGHDSLADLKSIINQNIETI